MHDVQDCSSSTHRTIIIAAQLSAVPATSCTVMITGDVSEVLVAVRKGFGNRKLHLLFLMGDVEEISFSSGI